jgi:hypothetical protein
MCWSPWPSTGTCSCGWSRPHRPRSAPSWTTPRQLPRRPPAQRLAAAARQKPQLAGVLRTIAAVSHERRPAGQVLRPGAAARTPAGRGGQRSARTLDGPAPRRRGLRLCRRAPAGFGRPAPAGGLATRPLGHGKQPGTGGGAGGGGPECRLGPAGQRGLRQPRALPGRQGHRHPQPHQGTGDLGADPPGRARPGAGRRARGQVPLANPVDR